MFDDRSISDQFVPKRKNINKYYVALIIDPFGQVVVITVMNFTFVKNFWRGTITALPINFVFEQ